MSLPFLCATRKANSWVEVLDCYSRSYKAMKGIYVPNSLEVTYGIQRMTTSWSLSLFYYSIFKSMDKRLNNAIATAALRQYRHLGNFAKMKKVFEEDININSNTGSYSIMLLASYTGMWEKALEIYQSNPTLRHKNGVKKNIVKSLCIYQKWETALESLRTGYTIDNSPNLIRPIIKSLSSQNLHNDALRLAASSFASGHSLDVELLSALIKPMNFTGQWGATLYYAHTMRLLSPHIKVQTFHFSLYNSIVDSLYQADIYYPISVIQVVEDVSQRLKPTDHQLSSSKARNHFRLMAYNEVQKKYFAIVQSLNHIFFKLIKIPSWYHQSFLSIVESIYLQNSVGIVLDTNFVMQCISKNLPLEHFLPSIVKQHPDLSEFTSKVVVVPFTTLQEMYHLIWDDHNHVRRSIKILLWSRLMVLLRRPDIVCLPFSSEFPCISLSMLSRMAYEKSNKSLSTSFSCNPDVRILNVCLTLQHYIRCKEVVNAQGSSPAEGIMLFSLLKYHVRRFNNTARGPATLRLLLCTLDKNLSEAATEAGILCFPILCKR